MSAQSQASEPPAPHDSIARGRYLLQIAGCNDCHTPRYAETGGNVPQEHWLTGTALGWRGDWGTTYPANLRLFVQGLTEDQWVAIARTARFRPPMPSVILREMNEADLRALYRFINHLGPAGRPAPSYLPPDRAPTHAVVQFPSSGS